MGACGGNGRRRSDGCCWDLAAPAQTKVYSVCDGEVVRVNYTQSENVPYDKSKNSVGNTIRIKCDKDYEDKYYVVFAHLYPNSAKVKAGRCIK